MKTFIKAILFTTVATMASAESVIEDSTITPYRTALPSWSVAPSADTIIPSTDDNSFGRPAGLLQDQAELSMSPAEIRRSHLAPYVGHSYRYVDFTPMLNAPLNDGAFSRSKNVKLQGLRYVREAHDLPEGFDELTPRELPYYKITANIKLSEKGDHVLQLAEGEFVDVYFVLNVLYPSSKANGCRIMGVVGDKEVVGVSAHYKLQYKKSMRLENNKTHHVDFDLTCLDELGDLKEANIETVNSGNSSLNAETFYIEDDTTGYERGLFDAKYLPSAFPKLRYGIIVKGTKSMVPFAKVSDEQATRLSAPPHEDPEMRVFWEKGSSLYSGWKSEPFHSTNISMVTQDQQDHELNHYRNAKSFLANGVFYPKEQGIYEFILITESNLCARYRPIADSWGSEIHDTIREYDPLHESMVLSPPKDVEVFSENQGEFKRLTNQERKIQGLLKNLNGDAPHTTEMLFSIRSGLPCIAYVHPAAMASFRDGDAPLRLPYLVNGLPTRALHTTMVFEELDVEYGAELMYAGRSVLYDNNNVGTPIFEAYASDLDEIANPSIKVNDLTKKQHDTSGYSVNSDYVDIDHKYVFPATTRVSDRFKSDVLIDQKISLYVRPPNELDFRPLNKQDFMPPD